MMMSQHKGVTTRPVSCMESRLRSLVYVITRGTVDGQVIVDSGNEMKVLEAFFSF